MARKTNRALVTTEEERNKILEENKELVEDFLNYLETTDHAPKSINVYKSNLNIFFVWLMKFAKNKDFALLASSALFFCLSNSFSVLASC